MSSNSKKLLLAIPLDFTNEGLDPDVAKQSSFLAFFVNEHLDLLELDSIYLRPKKPGFRIFPDLVRNPDSGFCGSKINGVQFQQIKMFVFKKCQK